MSTDGLQQFGDLEVDLAIVEKIAPDALDPSRMEMVFRTRPAVLSFGGATAEALRQFVASHDDGSPPQTPEAE